MVYHVQPFMLVGLGVLFFAERLSAAKVGWLLLAFAGLMLIVSAKGSGQATGTDYLLGVCLALASTFFYAVAAAITKRLKDLPAHLIVLIQMVAGVLVLAPFVCDQGHVPARHTGRQVGRAVGAPAWKRRDPQ